MGYNLFSIVAKGGEKMKEASGEANMTVITIVLIGVVVAIATPLINGLMNNASKSACCQATGGIWKNNKCTGGSTTC